MSLKPQNQLFKIFHEALDRQLRSGPSHHNSSGRADEKTIFISKWVDYSNKFGFAYQLSSNVVGVLMEQEKPFLWTCGTRSICSRW